MPAEHCREDQDSPVASFCPNFPEVLQVLNYTINQLKLRLHPLGNHELEPQFSAKYASGVAATAQAPNGSQFQSYIHRNPIPYAQVRRILFFDCLHILETLSSLLACPESAAISDIVSAAECSSAEPGEFLCHMICYENFAHA